MATARMTALQQAGLDSSKVATTFTGKGNAAVETAVDSYATRLLRDCSPPEACIDDSLGPYVTSVLRCSASIKDVSVECLPEYNSLIELLIEHCHLDSEKAHDALDNIVKAVKTGVVEFPVHSMAKASYGSSLKGSLGLIGMALSAEPSLERGTRNVARDGLIGLPSTVTELFSPFPGTVGIDVDHSGPQSSSKGTPVKLDRLIPMDLLGVLNDPSTPETKADRYTRESNNFPPLGSSLDDGESKRSTTQSSITDSLSDLRIEVMPSSSQDHTTSFVRDTHGHNKISVNHYYEMQVGSTVEMLMTMNHDLGEEAAVQAATLGGADVNVAQYVIDSALSAPPVCRHMLNDGCYRSDCQFSHDVEGHTCIFWMRGRCGKGDSCRFLHGFAKDLLDGIDLPPSEMSQWDSSGSLSPQTSLESPSSLQHGNSSSQGTEPEKKFPKLGAPWGSSGQHFACSSGQQSVSSFASIASKGYGDGCFGGKHRSAAAGHSVKQKFMKIPQDLWNPHINRNAGAFHISNPIERFKEVNKSITREDVIDLHFQSTKTFQIVLETFLPRKLRESDVWIVTGSGHHVGRSTHQKGGGALESAVQAWLDSSGYVSIRGRDRNGHGGAILVKKI